MLFLWRYVWGGGIVLDGNLKHVVWIILNETIRFPLLLQHHLQCGHTLEVDWSSRQQANCLMNDIRLHYTWVSLTQP
jgi:hypothetical protein